MSHRNILIISAACAISYACYVRGDQNPYARYVANAFQSIDRWSLEQVSNDELFGGAVSGMVAVLNGHGDHYTSFIPHERAVPWHRSADSTDRKSSSTYGH